jgi:RNA polymerase sigma factor (sigma-70 family)
MQEAHEVEAQRSLPGEREWLRSALVTDQDGILTATRARLVRLAHARGMDPQVIDDVVQETLLEAWSHLDRLRSLTGFAPWIDEICRNVCRRTNRKQQHALLYHLPTAVLFAVEEGEGSVQEEDLVEVRAPESFDPVEELSRQDLTRLLDRALGALSPASRQVIELCDLVELPRAEVAVRLHLSSGALDTRLHRARHHLRQVLSGPLRGEAEGYGVVLDDAPEEGWQATRLWCPTCARRRLEGCFVHPDDLGGPNLHLRCPDCSRRLGRDTAHSMGLVSLTGLRSFRPAWKRTMQGLAERVTEALSHEKQPCLNCGKPALFTVESGSTETSLPAGAHSFWIRSVCAHCGECISPDDPFPSADQLIYWAHPRTRQFLLLHPRWMSSPGQEIEHEGTQAISFHLSDLEGADGVTVVVDRARLRILTLS